MNEPHRGYVDLPSLYEFDYNTDLHLSATRKYTVFGLWINPDFAHSFCFPVIPVGCGTPHRGLRVEPLIPHAD